MRPTAGAAPGGGGSVGARVTAARGATAPGWVSGGWGPPFPGPRSTNPVPPGDGDSVGVGRPPEGSGKVRCSVFSPGEGEQGGASPGSILVQEGFAAWPVGRALGKTAVASSRGSSGAAGKVR